MISLMLDDFVLLQLHLILKLAVAEFAFQTSVRTILFFYLLHMVTTMDSKLCLA